MKNPVFRINCACASVMCMSVHVYLCGYVHVCASCVHVLCMNMYVLVQICSHVHVCMCVSSVHDCLEIDNKGHTLKLK